MPPIFGILHTKLQPFDPEMIRRMNSAARYITRRKVESVSIAGGYLGTAVTMENPLVPAQDTVATIGPWTIIADAALYKQVKPEVYKNAAMEILEAWMKWGKDCVKHLYGDFAFGIFNTSTGEIFCARDHLGIRPFYYSRVDDIFAFGSEIRYVITAQAEKPVIRLDYLLDTLVTVKTSKDMTAYENIFRLIPGHSLHFYKGNITLNRYWEPDPEKRIRFTTEAEYVELFREKLEAAVNMRCSGVPVLGTELSGGLDSSTVSGIAADFVNSKGKFITAFSNVFPENSSMEFKDEREYVSYMREHKKFNCQLLEILRQKIPVLLKNSIEIQDCYIQQNFSIFNQSLYESAGESGVQVLLSGFGGDELTSARTAIPWNELIQERQWKILSGELFYQGITVKSLLKLGLITFRYIKSLLDRGRYTSGIFTPELLDKRFANLPINPQFAGKHKLRSRMGKTYRKEKKFKLSERQIDRIMLDHLPQRLEYCYTAAAQYGIEYRYPLLDVKLIETTLAFPPWMKQHHGINRYIFRQAIRGFVPDKIRLRDDKSGSTIPQSYYSLVNEGKEISDIVTEATRSEFLMEIFDLSRFPEWYERLVKRDPQETNYVMPGAFYNYLMIMLYYRDKGQAGLKI